MVEIGDWIRVTEPRHLYFNCQGRVIGKRGERAGHPGEYWLWVFLSRPSRPIMIASSMAKAENIENDQNKLIQLRRKARESQNPD